MRLPTDQRPSIWSLALWFACLTGLTQTLLLKVAGLATDRIIFASSDIVWMAPLADAVVFAFVAMGIRLVQARVKSRFRPVWVLTAFLFLFLIGPMLMVPRLHPSAATALALGAAVQLARLFVRRVGRLDSLVRRTLPVLIGLIVVSGTGLHVYRLVVERRIDASAPFLNQTTTPNVLLVVLDTVRAKSLGLYGYDRPTSPQLEQLAKRGVVFERALSTSPWTLPSHGSIFTGRYPHQLSADWLTPLDDAYPTLADVLARRGYSTAGFVGNLIYATAETGLGRGFHRYRDYPVSASTALNSSWLTRTIVAAARQWLGEADVRKTATQVNAEFLDWLGTGRGRPFFAFLNYFDPHAPYAAPAPFDTMFGDGGPRGPLALRRSWSKPEIQRSMDDYDGELAYVDHELGQLLEALTARGLVENTLIVVTSDHGEQFGEHGLFDHGNGLYRPALEVPLVVSFPGRVPAGVRVAGPVSLIDLAATIVDLTHGNEESLPGHSLARYWSGHPSDVPEPPLLAEVSKGINTDPWLPITQGSMQSVVAHGLRYIRRTDGHEELYDFDRDPAELHDLAQSTAAAASLQESRRALDAALEADTRSPARRRGTE